jgi:xylan 1,4-beta-xylosidase
LVQHYRIDGAHSNSFEKWKAMGKPQQPTAEQYAELERAGQLGMIGSPQWVETADQSAVLKFDLPRQAVSLLVLTW